LLDQGNAIWANCTVQAAAAADLPWRRLRALLDGYATKMLRFIAEAYRIPPPNANFFPFVATCVYKAHADW
jgi:hypothetical protein